MYEVNAENENKHNIVILPVEVAVSVTCHASSFSTEQNLPFLCTSFCFGKHISFSNKILSLPILLYLSQDTLNPNGDLAYLLETMVIGEENEKGEIKLHGVKIIQKLLLHMAF